MPRTKPKTTGAALTKIRPLAHGLFAEGAGRTPEMMRLLATMPNWPTISDARKEAIHMVVHKVFRILAGDPSHADHWDDIGGYAELGKLDGQTGKIKKPRAPAVKKLKQRVARVKHGRAFKEVQAALRAAARSRKAAEKKAKKKVAKKKMAARPPVARGGRPRVAKRVAKTARRPRVSGTNYTEPTPAAVAGA